MNTVKSKKIDTKKLVMLAVLTAIAYIAVFLFRIPVVMFLKYEPKDIIITIAGFIYGPAAVFMMSFIISLIEMVTISGTGPIGALMNFLSTVSFAGTAAFIYQKHRKLSGAVIGIITGSVVMVIFMLAWNYIVTPIYMETPREVVAEMLPTVFLPFNLLKAALNTSFVLLVYKPITTMLKRMNVIPSGETASAPPKKAAAIAMYIISAIILVTCIIIICLPKN